MPVIRSLLLALLLGLTAVAPTRGAAEARLDPLAQWLGLATAQDDQRLLQQLRVFSEDASIALERREAMLFDFVTALRSLPPRSVGHEVLGFLQGYTPRFVRPHEDHASGEVPVYNIRAAAAGLEHSWQRQEAAYAGSVLLLQDPARLVQAYLLHHEPPIRQGLLDALGNASVGQLESVGFMALSALEADPALAVLAGEAALLTGDTRALEQLLRNGSGAGLAQVLRKASGVLSEDQLARVLGTAIREARPETAAVAIAQLSPGLHGNRAVEEGLLDLLEDPALGSAAALALSALPGERVKSELRHRAESGGSAIASGRARMALELAAARQASAGAPQ